MRERDGRRHDWAEPGTPATGTAADASTVPERPSVATGPGLRVVAGVGPQGAVGPSSGVGVARGDARASDRDRTPATTLEDGPVMPGVVGAGGVLDEAFDLLRFRFRRLVALTAVVIVPVQLLDLWIALDGGTSRSGLDGSSPTLQILDSTASSSGWTLVLLCLQATAMFLLGMAVGHLVAGWVDGRDDPFATIVGAVARRLWVVPVVVVVGLVAKSAATCFGGIGFFFVDALLLVAGPVAGGERLGPFATIGRSVRLARRAYGTALAVSVGGFTITVILRIALVAGPALLIAAIGLPEGWAVLIGQASSLTLLVTLPLTACIAARAHLELRCRVEGEDLFRHGTDLGLVGGART